MYETSFLGISYLGTTLAKIILNKIVVFHNTKYKKYAYITIGKTIFRPDDHSTGYFSPTTNANISSVSNIEGPGRPFSIGS
jgi:hypothetical protein